ncbi:GNAT family N-acetyltransferase [Uliginosibacterium sp. H3]|uniref:GNAT family N-acetyltransferase n=1 Tax=Uliginosibacterium silvisoli TaxID=3114758 RepID=A0ABU6K4T3_9RHOO|nr:GNAT family N-acetyltransferase [Uliginosibacterium sp. H3]
MTIEPVTAADIDSFIEYLNDHLADNGVGDRYFQPMPKGTSRVLPQMEDAFRAGLGIHVGKAGWRQVWVARNSGRKIIGHIDLRSRPEPFSEHRCLLGMGVDRDHRKSGLGTALLSHAVRWATEIARLEWIDLQVLSGNEPAIRLYLRAGFIKTGELPEMFRIDGQSLSYTSMSKRLTAT